MLVFASHVEPCDEVAIGSGDQVGEEGVYDRDLAVLERKFFRIDRDDA